MAEERIQLVLLPGPMTGHLFSIVELAKQLVKQRRFSANILLMRSLSPGMDTISADAPIPDIRFIHLPPVDLTPDDHGPEAFFALYVQAHKPLVREAIAKIISPSIPVAALIIDAFATTIIDVAADLGIPTYLYFTSGAAMLGIMLYLPTLHEKIPQEFGDLQVDVEIPGILPLPPSSMPPPLGNKKSDNYAWFFYHSRRFSEAQGIIVNTFSELEPAALQAITAGRCLPDHATPPIYPIGPSIVLDDNSPPDPSGLFLWLDQQPHESVVFLCFGSMGTFPVPQVKEIALGLEKSGHRFLWSLRRRPSEKFTFPIDADLKEVLPDGFLDRTKGQGLVWPSWVPQAAILAHPVIGGFVSHCGWNSILESLWFGVPILTWPLYAEQRLNAFVLVRELGLAMELRLEYGEERMVEAEELERGVRSLMGENEEVQNVRKKVNDMSKKSRIAMDDGGSSMASLAQLADILVRGTRSVCIS